LSTEEHSCSRSRRVMWQWKSRLVPPDLDPLEPIPTKYSERAVHNNGNAPGRAADHRDARSIQTETAVHACESAVSRPGWARAQGDRRLARQRRCRLPRREGRISHRGSRLDAALHPMNRTMIIARSVRSLFAQNRAQSENHGDYGGGCQSRRDDADRSVGMVRDRAIHDWR
jgi:hypothetical protein